MTSKAPSVCIVTNYATTTNFGALLQAYALNRVVNALGYPAETLFVTGSYGSKRNKLLRQLRAGQFTEVKNETLSYLRRLRVRGQLEARKQAMEAFRNSIPHTKKYNKEDLDDLQNHYDVFLCGSDQIFRPDKNTGEPEPYYFLDMVKNGRVKASYAASMGIAAYTPETEEKVAGLLASFDFVSMREKSAADYIAKITGRNDVVSSVDPVFLLGRDEWESLITPYDADGKYILVYMIHGTEKLYRSIRAFAQKTGLKILSFPSMSYRYKPYEKGFADREILDADPPRFLDLIRRSAYFFTDSFHGTALSLILHKEAFVSRANGIAFSRIAGILELFGLASLVIPEDGQEPEFYTKERSVDWESVEKKIQEQRMASEQYLLNVMKEGRRV